MLDQVRSFFTAAAPSMPHAVWWIAAVVLALLMLAAVIDLFTAIVPDPLIFLGVFLTTGAQGLFGAWDEAAAHLRAGIAAALLVWVVNYLWYRKFHRDALGMGDAKWTLLTVACFGAKPALIAWGAGSVIAVLFLLSARLARRRITHVAFVPFLLAGLAVALYGEACGNWL